MPLVLTEEQESIRRTVRDFVRERLPLSQVRAARDARDSDSLGFSRAAWSEMAGLGLSSVAIPEAWGGGGLGYAELGLVLEECGRCLAMTPLLSTMVLGAGALLLGGTDAQKGEMLPLVCAGERILALAHDEGTRHDRYRVRARAEQVEGGGWRVHGEKTMVLDAHVADLLLVVARVSGADDARDGLGVFAVPRGSRGLSVERLSLVDGRNAATVRLDAVAVAEGDVVGQVGRGADLLDPLLDRATVALCAEMLGSALEAFETTIAYLKTRKQFGVPIGSFQALKHRAAQMFCELELSKSIVLEALRAIDAERADVPWLASAAKARLTDTLLLVANEAIQMHGGIGVTDELDIGFFLKRARVAGMTLGDAAYHRERYARGMGY